MTDMTTHPNHPPTPPDDWRPASGAEIVRLARRLKRRKSRRRFLKAGGGIIGGVLALAGGWWVVRSMTREREYDFGGITCSEVAARTDDLMQGRLPADEVAKVKQHVMLCPNCKPKFERMGGMKTVGHLMPACRRLPTT
jgi:hypothetical protein